MSQCHLPATGILPLPYSPNSASSFAIKTIMGGISHHTTAVLPASTCNGHSQWHLLEVLGVPIRAPQLLVGLGPTISKALRMLQWPNLCSRAMAPSSLCPRPFLQSSLECPFPISEIATDSCNALYTVQPNSSKAAERRHSLDEMPGISG